MKSKNHEAMNLLKHGENVVKNWEIEADFEPEIKNWRDIDHANFSPCINGGVPQSAKHMLKLAPPTRSYPQRILRSCKLGLCIQPQDVKRTMPTLAWELMEVQSGPPLVAYFERRRWGNLVAEAHGRQIDIQGMAVAKVKDEVGL